MPSIHRELAEDTPTHRAGRKPIDAAKECVSVEELAERLSGPGVRRGREIAFVCQLHDDHDPSLMVDPEKQVWYCHPCSVGGDVVELARLAWDYPDDGLGAATAAAYLLMEFGHEVPQRPASWHRKQDRQAKVRDRLERARIEHVRRLVFRLCFLPLLRQLPEQLRDDIAEDVWNDTLPIARMLYDEQRRGA